MSIDMSPRAISARLRQASELARDLAPARRLSTKLDMSPAALSARLREAAALLELCHELARHAEDRGSARE